MQWSAVVFANIWPACRVGRGCLLDTSVPRFGIAAAGFTGFQSSRNGKEDTDTLQFNDSCFWSPQDQRCEAAWPAQATHLYNLHLASHFHSTNTDVDAN